jgi:anthranilate phosphoribosyltransferase
VRELRGGDAADNLGILRSVLDGEFSAHLDAVILNAAAALVVAGIAEDALDGARRAGEAIASGRAREKLSRWVDAARERG